MTESAFFRIILLISFIVAAGTFVTLFFVSAPYGRHSRLGWGSGMPSWLGWLLMESVSAIGMLVMFLIGDAPRTAATVIFLLMWEAHYIHRAFIYPFLLRGGKKKMPILVTFMAVIFNLGNAYLNGRYLFHFADPRYTHKLAAGPALYRRRSPVRARLQPQPLGR